MKRPMTFKMLVFLLLGAIINVAVAWGFALLIRPSNQYSRQVEVSAANQVTWRCVGAHRTITHSPDGWYPTRAWKEYRSLMAWSKPDTSEALPSQSFVHPETTCFRNLRGAVVVADARGWPFQSLRGAFAYPQAHDQRISSGFICLKSGNEILWNNGILRTMEDRGLPLMPIWPGFLINTIFYAGIACGAWMIFKLPFAIRHRRRMKRGECVRCAYPLGTNDKCTECGATVLPGTRVRE